LYFLGKEREKKRKKKEKNLLAINHPTSINTRHTTRKMMWQCFQRHCERACLVIGSCQTRHTKSMDTSHILVYGEHAPIAFRIFLLINQNKKTKMLFIGVELKKKCEKMKKCTYFFLNPWGKKAFIVFLNEKNKNTFDEQF